MTTTEIHDPRPYYGRALTWVHGLITAVSPDQLDAPTPCPEYDVRELLRHLVMTVDKARTIGEGGDIFTVPLLDTPPTGGWAAAYAQAVDHMWTVWSDDALLDRTLSAPWGDVPGRATVWGYLNETLVHGWDLAVATGQDSEADPELAAAVLAAAGRFLPAEHRGGEIPFADVVPSRPDAGPTERLANWSGRARR